MAQVARPGVGRSPDAAAGGGAGRLRQTVAAAHRISRWTGHCGGTRVDSPARSGVDAEPDHRPPRWHRVKPLPPARHLPPPLTGTLVAIAMARHPVRTSPRRDYSGRAIRCARMGAICWSSPRRGARPPFAVCRVRASRSSPRSLGHVATRDRTRLMIADTLRNARSHRLARSEHDPQFGRTRSDGHRARLRHSPDFRTRTESRPQFCGL